MSYLQTRYRRGKRAGHQQSCNNPNYFVVSARIVAVPLRTIHTTMKTPIDDHALVLSFIENHATAMLTTMSHDTLRARPMHIVQTSYRGTVYFFVPHDADIINEITGSSLVNIAFSDIGSTDHLSLSGVATISKNLNMYGELWNDEMNLWFPQGPEGGEAALIEIVITHGECWKGKGRLVQLYERAKAKATDTIPELSDHRKFIY